VHQKGVNSMDVSGLSYRKVFVDTRKFFSLIFGVNELRNKPPYLVGLSSQHSRPIFWLYQVGISHET